jgi:hypothetical protein
MLKMVDSQVGIGCHWQGRLLLLLALLSATAGRLVAAETNTMRTITAILIEFVHQCTPSQHDALEAIVNKPAATTQERLLAQALLNVEHTPSPDDKPALLALMRDRSVSAIDRTLACVIYNLVHRASDADKKQLRQLKKN